MDNIGERLTYCRSTLGLTRKDLSSQWGGASVPSISRWELNVIEPAQKKITALSDFFCSTGLVVSPDWISLGRGAIPSLLNMKEFSENDFDSMCEKSFLSLNQKINNFIYYKVTSNFFSPIIRYGDYVGGVKIFDDLVNHLNSLVFVIKNNVINVGFLSSVDSLEIKNSQDKILAINDCDVIAKVTWSAIRP